MTVSSDALSLDVNQADGTLAPLTVSFAKVADIPDDQNTTDVNESVTIAGYTVYRSDDGVDFSAVGDVPKLGWTPDSYDYTDNTAVDGVKYW